MTKPSTSAIPSSYCLYRSPAGRQCRQLACTASLGLCEKHAGPQFASRQPDDFRKILTHDTDEFTTAMGIHNSISELYKLLAADLISARRAAVLAYIANLLLRTIPIVHSELDPDSSKDSVRIDFGDLPRPKRNQPVTLTAESSHSS